MFCKWGFQFTVKRVKVVSVKRIIKDEKSICIGKNEYTDFVLIYLFVLLFYETSKINQSKSQTIEYEP